MKALSVGTFTGLSNTCLHRHWALKSIVCNIDEINTNSRPCSLWFRIAYHLFLYGLPIRLPENNKENKEIIDCINKNNYDIVWIDKGITIFPETLRAIRKTSPQTKIISYSPDNMTLRHNQSQQYIECVPLYDYIITNKSYIINEIYQLGARKVIFVNNTYQKNFHYPRILTEQDYIDYGAEVGFVGTWEKERCESILYLAEHGVKVRVFGSGKWDKYKNYSPNLIIEGRSLTGEDFCKSLQATKINLCFLRKMNFDQQTTRTVEIPACGGFMLAERTKEHLDMFEENKEAAYFSNNQELLNKCLYFQKHEDERFNIARAGLRRCKESDYSNEGMIRKVLKQIYE